MIIIIIVVVVVDGDDDGDEDDDAFDYVAVLNLLCIFMKSKKISLL